LLLAAFAFSTPFAALAQNSPYGHWVNDPKNTATPGFVYDVPPAGFNALTASDAELEQWGFPPRPRSSDVKAYSLWKRIATATRVVPQLTFTHIYNGPARNVKTGSAVNNATAATSENWSGYVVYEPEGTFSGNNPINTANWTVPAVAPVPPATCSSATYASSQWVGFDGWDSNDVLQAGTAADCGNSDYAWYEWYPNAETIVSLPVGPGDYVTVEVSYCGGCSVKGSALLLNDVTGKSVSIGFNPPSGATYLGDSAEWIMERPTVNGALADLPNYSLMYFSYAAANVGFEPYDPSNAPDGTILQVSMTCPPWVPSSGCEKTTTISGYSNPTGLDLDTFYVFYP
jgi:hypothetical protein